MNVRVPDRVVTYVSSYVSPSGVAVAFAEFHPAPNHSPASPSLLMKLPPCVMLPFTYPSRHCDPVTRHAPFR